MSVRVAHLEWLLCEECEDHIIVPDSMDGAVGCCPSCGVAYMFDCLPGEDEVAAISA